MTTAQQEQPRGTCDFTVSVPAYTTGVVGTSVPWSMRYCHIRAGKPPAEIEWTVTAEHCSDLHPSPGSGSLTISDGECRDVQVSIPIPNDVCARSDATLNNASEACEGKHHGDSGKLCILPTGERTEALGHLGIGSGVGRFRGWVQPETADFAERTVKEEQGATVDGLHWGVIPAFTLQGDDGAPSTWVVGAGNQYGDDIIGYPRTGLIDIGVYLTINFPEKLPASTQCKQIMKMLCRDGFHAYATNDILVEVRRNGEVYVSRDGARVGPM